MSNVALIEVGCTRPELNEPIGICTIASYLAQENGLIKEQVRLFWQQLQHRRADVDGLSDVHLIGISAQINSLQETLALYAGLRSRYPGVPIVIGNLLAIYAGDELLSLLPDAILCVGEGEMPFSEIFRKIAAGNDLVGDRAYLQGIPGLMYSDGKQVLKSQPVLTDLSKSPTPRRDFTADLVRIGGITRIEGSRGCHWGRCEFCSVASRFGLGGYRRFRSDRLVADLEELARLGARSPYFSDEDFFGRRYSESRQVADLIIEAKKNGRIPSDMNFFVSVLSSDVKHPEGQAALEHWKKAGLREVFVGIEAGADPEIKRFAKKANSDTNTTALNRLIQLGFQVDIGFIMFDPMMTLDDLEQNISWLRRQPLSDIDARVTKRLRIQPRTGLEEKYRALVVGPLDVDELTFPTVFEDQHVANIERLFRSWEDRFKRDVYTMLGSARGETGSERRRLDLKRRLAKIRDVDVDYLSQLVRYERGELAEEDLNELGDRLHAAKATLIVRDEAV
ncbi:hypothetical protein GPL17_19015 [Bradyrhizobium yuanmingense]|uniref:B12-binding domain-containing radical SAM protein n=1 Tax=Bradyrhizobium yuanmingense TaxID=108015 RepID=UPI0012FBAA0D|nr:radical SAM protein [Bradyrhizobium yuanmingense]MVT52575.1 hypothetical protein [Bradyrhizobium yuanmingense]